MSDFERTEKTYTEVNGYLIPNLILGEQKPIGKYGMMHLNYLKKHCKVTYQTMKIEGTLNGYLYDINAQSEETVENIIRRMAENEGVNEEMKASDQMLWVRKTNAIKNAAEEIVLHDIVYA